LASQFETLERPQADEGAIVVPAGGTTAEQMRMVLEALGPAARAEGA